MRLILVIISMLVGILAFTWSIIFLFQKEMLCGILTVIVGCVFVKIWQYLINTDKDVDMHIE